jgi:hypothetical protein
MMATVAPKGQDYSDFGRRFGDEAVGASVAEARRVDAPWSPPDMSILSAGRSPPPAMPPGLFRGLWPLISDLAHGAGAPVDYVAMSVLAVSASLVGGKRRVRPFAESDWEEPCILWVAVVGDPSSNKSPAIDVVTGPLRQIEADHADEHRAVRREYETGAERAKAERRAWEEAVKAATKDRTETPERPEAAEMPDEPQRRRLLVQDATPEAVGAILSGNPTGTLHLRDELAGWLMSFDRYSPGGREFWLEAFGGRSFVVDRKGAAAPLIVPFNGVSVLGGIQPEKLAACLLGGADDGLVPRFLWAWPDAIPFHRPVRIADAPRLEQMLRRLDGLSPGYGPKGDRRAVTLPLSAGAADIFSLWCSDHLAGIGDAASLYKGFCGKLRGTVLRIALAAELMAWAASDSPEPREISGATVAAAIEFVEDYAKPTAIRVFGDAALPPVERNAAILARHILKHRLTLINARDLRRSQGLPPTLKDSASLEEAVEHLVEADWLRATGVRAGESPGRSRKDFSVNPAVHGGVGG